MIAMFSPVVGFADGCGHCDQRAPGTRWMLRIPRSWLLAQRGSIQVAWRNAAELAARADVELGEDLAQVVLDRARAEKQPGADLRVREALAGQPGDLGLLGGQVERGGYGAFAGGGLAGGLQLAPSPRRERRHSHRIQHAVGRAQLLARVSTAALSAQPLPVQQMGAA